MAPIHVLLCFDDAFWGPAFAVIRSAALGSSRPADLVFHLFHSGLAAAHLAEFDAIAREFPVRLEHLPIDAHPAYRAFVAELPIARPFTPVIYARLLLDALLPADVERLVYLDCDTLVRGPLEELHETPLEGRSIGAVLDPHRHVHMMGRDLKRNADLFAFNAAYFNSGVLLVDRKRFAAADVPARTRDLARQGLMNRLQYDQAALNLIFRDDWLPLDFRWNLINPVPAHEVLEPSIVHYTGPRKPWSPLPGAAFHRLYRHAMTNDVYYRFMRERTRRRALRLIGLKR